VRATASWLCLPVALACLAAPARGATHRVPPDHWERNLVPNPGLELDADANGLPDGWNLPPGQCAWDADAKHSGARSLRFTNTDRDVYRLVTAPVALIPGVRYRIAAWVKGKDVRNGDVHDQGAGLCLEWMDAAGNWLGGHYPSCKPGTFDWTQLEGETGAVPATAARGHVVLYLRQKNTGTAWFDDVEVRAVRGLPLLVRLVAPAYRAAVEAPTKGKTIGVEVSLNRREHDLPPRGLQLRLSLPDAAFPPRPAPEDDQPARLSWELPELPAGTHPLVVRLLSGEEALAEEKIALHVVEPSARAVTLDGQGRLLVEGKPFFPLGLYLGPTEDEHLARIAEAGFNTILCYGYGAGKDPRAYLDRAAKHGLKVIYSIKDFYENSKWYPKQGKTSDLDLMRKYVTDLRDHPALLAWYTNDELGPIWMPKLQAAYDLVCELDPGHPAFQVLCVPSQNRLYYGVTDVLGVDPYPIPRHPVTMVGEWMETAREAMSAAKPVWCVPQIFQWANYSKNPKDREPTFAEKRAMIYLALIHRAQGLVGYSYYDLLKGDDKAVFARRWGEVSAIAADVRRLIPALLEGREAGADRESAVRYRVLEAGGAAYAIVVNTHGDAAADIAIPIPRGAAATRLDTGRPAALRDGKLIDTLQALESALYLVK